MTFHTLDSFLKALAEAGLSMHEGRPIADGSLHRYRIEGDKSGTKNGWYMLHLDASPFGAFGSWKTGQSLTWTANNPQSMSEAERQALATRIEAAKRVRAVELANVQAEAAKRALHLWGKSKVAGNDHPYLINKGVRSFGLRYLRRQLVIPLHDEHSQIHSLQFIAEDGRKTFLTGGRKKGCYYAIGRPGEVICICEGYATGASILQATGYATAIAFDCGNLEPVARVLRHKFPHVSLVIAADNDVATIGNPGLAAAKKAAQAVNAALAYPKFTKVAHA